MATRIDKSMRNRLSASMLSVHGRSGPSLEEPRREEIGVDLDGVVGDRHRSNERKRWAGGDEQPEGTRRRNERQWPAISLEELEQISADTGPTDTPDPADAGAGLCPPGFPESGLPKGRLPEVPSGTVLLVEECNPACREMGGSPAAKYKSIIGEGVAFTAFSKAAVLSRGVVGAVEVPGSIRAGDTVQLTAYRHPPWLDAPLG